jgi:adenosine/AMP kinase
VTSSEIQWHVVAVHNPDAVELIIGQAHFIKTVEDVHEALMSSMPAARFGLAFCEASAKRLIRRSGTDRELISLAVDNIRSISAGHSFIIFLKDAFPVNCLNELKMVPEVCHIFCATSNPVQVIVAETSNGRGIVGVIDGAIPLGVESDQDVAERMALLRRFGYKL